MVPLLLWPYLIVYVKGTRVQIRKYLRDPKHHAPLAALVSTSWIFTFYVVIMDFVAIGFAYSANEPTKHTSSHDFVPFGFIILSSIVDLSVLVIAVMLLLALLLLQRFESTDSERCCRTECWFNWFLVGIFCCRKFKDIQSKDDHKNEQTVWLLTGVFVAPFIAFGTHLPYIIVAWVQYPDHAAAISIMYLLSFLYLFITLRFLYLSLPDKTNCCKCCEETVEIGTPETEKADQEDLEKNFQVWKVWAITFLGILVCGFEVWFLAGLLTLPIVEVIDDAPTYIFAFFRTIFILFTGLITYKLLTYKKRSDNTTFLETVVKACKYMYDGGPIPSVETDVRKAALLLSVLMKEHKYHNQQYTENDVHSRADNLWKKAVEA